MVDTVGAATCVIDGVFPREAIGFLNAVADAEAHRAEAGGVVHPDASRHIERHVRRSRVSWLSHSAETRPLYEMVAQLVAHANQQVFRYELSGLNEPAQLATYRAEEEGFYGWHVDIGGGPLANRKISLVIPLTDPAAYQGGGFEVFHDSEPSPIEMPLGRVVMFPSYLLHRVRPVTAGVRRSLALWVSGPPFR
jgi:PKHD-type hydroxylase